MSKFFKRLWGIPVFSMTIETPDGLQHKIQFEDGATVLAAALKANIEIANSCVAGTCGTCRVEILEGESSDFRSEIESETALEKMFKPNERLACQILARPGLKVRVL